MASSPSSVIDLTCRDREGEAATGTTSDAAAAAAAAAAVNMDMAAASGVNTGTTTRPAQREGLSAVGRESVVPGGGPFRDSTNTTATSASGAAATAPARKKRKAPPPKSDGERCSICLDEWTSKGKHRICTLLCGHLFGKSCIERWLKERRSCPQCGAKVGTKGSNRVIPLFVQNLVAKDTGELETARTFLEEEKRLRKQCEAERVRLSIENASLKDQLSRQRTSSAKKNPNLNSSVVGSSGGGGGGYGYGFRPALVTGISSPSSCTSAMPRAGPGVGSSSSSVIAGYPSSGQNQGQRQDPNPNLGQGLATSGLGALTGAAAPGQAISSTQSGLPLLPSSSSAAGPAGVPGSSNNNGSEAPRQTSSPRARQTQGQGLVSPSPASGIADSRSERSTFPAAPVATDVGADVGGLLPMPSGPRNAGSATGAAAPTSPSATCPYSQQVPSPGDFHDSTGGDGDGGGGRMAAAASSREVVKVAVRSEQLLSRNVQAGRVVAFAGGAAGALLVSQEFGERRAQHGITKFSLADLRHHKNIHLHREQIRDIKFAVEGGNGNVSYMLSTGFDKTLKVCDLRTDSVVVSYDLEGNGWSCQWSATNPTQMFCGVVDGTRVSAVQLFDLRSTSGAVLKLRAAARQRQPIHSICHTADDLLLCATMGGVWAWGGGTKGAGGGGGSGSGEEQAERLQTQAGPCCSLSGASISSSSSGGGVARQDRFLVSTRGSSASHAVFGLQAPLAVSATCIKAAAAARGEQRTQSGGAEKGIVGGDGCRSRSRAREEHHHHHHQAIGNEAGAQEEGLKWDGQQQQQQRQAGQGASGAGAAVADYSWQSWSKRWTRFPGVMQGHQSQQTLSRSLLWETSPGTGLLVAGGDERTNQPWIWDASSGDVCSRLARHRSPVLDVASLQDGSSGKGLFAAVSQGEINVYQTLVFNT